MKAWVTLTGGALVLVGVVMLITPGPGLLTIAAGLAVLGREYKWARRLLERVRERIRHEMGKAKDRGRRGP